MSNTISLVAVAKKIETVLIDDMAQLGLEAVFFGDQADIPKSPTVCVEPVDKVKDLQGANRYCLVRFRVGVLLYHSRIQDDQLTREEADTFGEAIEHYLDSYQDGTSPPGTLGGLLIHGFVNTFESGYTVRNNNQFRSVRLTYEGLVKQLL